MSLLIRKTRTATRLAQQALDWWLRPLAAAQPGMSPRVLFVSEADGATLRYRVLNQIEQLQMVGMQAAAVHPNYHSILASARDCEILILYRVKNTPRLQRILEVARSHRALILFDTDDLIWDQRIVDYCNLEETQSAGQIRQLRQEFERTAALMRSVDAFIASTPFLAELIRADFSQPVFVNMNALSQATVSQSQALWVARQKRQVTEPLIIGYFSGWPQAHEPDFAVALEGLQQALEQLPQARLRIAGYFDTTWLPLALQARVELTAFVAYDRLVTAIAGIDINLAPIIENPHRRAKSAVKFLEAALVGVPTVATDLEPYQLIRQGETGYLATDPQSWTEHILTLAHNPRLRATIGEAARAQVLAEHTTAVRAAQFATLLKSL